MVESRRSKGLKLMIKRMNVDGPKGESGHVDISHFSYKIILYDS